MRAIYSIFILLTLSMLLLAGCGDVDHDRQALPDKPEVKNMPLEGPAEGATVAAEETLSDKINVEQIEPAKPEQKTNPYLALQYKKKKTDNDTRKADTENPLSETASGDADPLYGAGSAREKPQSALAPFSSYSSETTAEQEYYACPMHPSVVSEHEGVCPICGMHLVKQAKQDDAIDDASVVRLSSGIIQKIGVRTTAVVRGSLRKSLKVAGSVTYDEDRLTRVTSKTYGWVENLSLRRAGSMVKRGELLMELYAPEYLAVQKAFLKAQKIDKSAGQLKKYAERDETVPSRDFLRYLDVPESAINELTRSGKPRLRIPVYAPQFGEVVRLDVKKFSYVNEGDSMLTIADLSSVWVEANVFQHQLEWLRRNQEAEISVDVLPGERLKGRVSYIGPELDPRTRTVKVRLLVANPDYVLRPNMYAQVVIFDDAQQEILKIPREALIETGDRSSVIRALGDGLFMPVDVVAGFRSGGEVEIKSGLEEGDQVVISGQFLIDSEANLRASFRRLGHSHELMPSQAGEETHSNGRE